MGTFYFTNIIGAISRGESNVNWGIATLPHPEGVEAGWTVGSITPFAINNASKNKEAAWAFAKFITGPEGAKIYADGFAIPGMSSDAIIESIATADGMPAGSLEALRVSNIALDRPYMDHVAEVNQMLGEQHGLIMLGESTVDEGLAEMSLLSKEIQQ
jgi:multiple sugar transport system substrate-binding protein